MNTVEIEYKLDMEELASYAEDRLDSAIWYKLDELKREYGEDAVANVDQPTTDDVLDQCYFDEGASDFYMPTLRDYQNFELYKRFGFDLNDNRYLDDKAKQVLRVIEKLWLRNKLDERAYCADEAFIAYLTERNRDNCVYCDLMHDAEEDIDTKIDDIIDDWEDDIRWEKENG